MIHLYSYVYKLKICRNYWKETARQLLLSKSTVDSKNNQKPNLALNTEESVDAICTILMIKLTSMIEVDHDHVLIPVARIRN